MGPRHVCLVCYTGKRHALRPAGGCLSRCPRYLHSSIRYTLASMEEAFDQLVSGEADEG